MCADKSISEAVSEVEISDYFSCSTARVLNTVFDDIGRRVDPEQGLKTFCIEYFTDKNSLEASSLSRLTAKCHSAECIQATDLEDTTASNRSKLMDFVGKVLAAQSLKLHTLRLELTGSTAADGD